MDIIFKTPTGDGLTMDPIDRYRSCKGIDFDDQASRMITRIESHTQGTDDSFWTYFDNRRHATQGMQCDDQLLLASFVNQIRELFESRADDIGLAWLDQLENECF